MNIQRSIPELSPWLVPTRQIQSHHKGVRRTCEATSWEGTGDGAGEDRVPGFPTDPVSADLSYGIFGLLKGGRNKVKTGV